MHELSSMLNEERALIRTLAMEIGNALHKFHPILLQTTTFAYGAENFTGNHNILYG